MLKQELSASTSPSTFQLDGNSLTLQEYNELVNLEGGFSPLSEALRKKLAVSVDLVTDAVSNERVIYGVTTGLGGMSDARVGCSDVGALQENLLTFLAAAAGEAVDAQHTRGAMLLRVNVLLQGKSGVRAEVIERLLMLFQKNATPIVRELGSIGASGDLIPLATIARAVSGTCGRVAVSYNGEQLDAVSTLDRLGLQPIQLQAKEGLALVNGTSFSSAIAANATIAATQSLSLSFVIQSILMSALDVNADPFQPFVHQNKPHPGQIWSAKTILDLIVPAEKVREPKTGSVQDRYSLRCFPQYSGAVVEGIARVREVVTTEMNSVSDNPLIDPDSGQFYQSGNFLGQYIGIAMDDLRRFVGLLAKHLDVQVASLVAPEFNQGLSPSLRGNDDRSYNMGLKGLQICANSIVPMLTHSANPLVEHFPTHAEQFNQNINGLSWGAAQLAWKSVGWFQQYVAVTSLFAVQAIDLRAKVSLGHYDGRELLGDVARSFYDAVYDRLEMKAGSDRPYLFDDSDRWLEQDIASLVGNIAAQETLVESVAPVTHSFDQFCEGRS